MVPGPDGEKVADDWVEAREDNWVEIEDCKEESDASWELRVATVAAVEDALVLNDPS